jgi:HrpA-like RNA helicase
MEVDRVTIVSRSSATQRSGRAGGISNGICLRLYHEHELLETDLAPEILRLSLDTAIGITSRKLSFYESSERFAARSFIRDPHSPAVSQLRG